MKDPRKRSASLNYSHSFQPNNDNEYNENNNYEKNPCCNMDKNQENKIVNFNMNNNIANLVNKGYKVEIEQKQTIKKDGNTENCIKATIFPPDYNKEREQRKVANIITEKKVLNKKDFYIKNEIKSFQTGIFFKDTHYYNSPKVIPFNRKQSYERTVLVYNDGNINYGEWRET